MQLQVTEKSFLAEDVRLPPGKASTEEATPVETAKVTLAVSSSSSRQRWDGPFCRPSHGAITTSYGVRRRFNGKLLVADYFHGGLDYGASAGSPVVAPAGGRICLVGSEAAGFRVHGNCVALDHGHGVVSLLMHLESVAVRPGQCVSQGAMIGTVGSSGRSTGAHLHWGLFVHGSNVDPEPWMAPSPQQIWEW